MLKNKKCVPCEGGDPLPEEKENELIKEIEGWEIIRDGVHRIEKTFKFKDFKKAIEFVNKVAKIAEEENHHPDILIQYNKVKIILWTHKVKGLSENDFILASKIDDIEKEQK